MFRRARDSVNTVLLITKTRFTHVSKVILIHTETLPTAYCDFPFLKASRYGCETWSLTLREERRLRVFEGRVLRRIFGPNRNVVTREWRKLHNEELNCLYSSPNIVRVTKSRRMRWAGHIARMGERRGVYRVLVGKPEGKRSLGRPRSRWEDNIKLDLQEVGCGVWTGSSCVRIGTGGGHL